MKQLDEQLSKGTQSSAPRRLKAIYHVLESFGKIQEMKRGCVPVGLELGIVQDQGSSELKAASIPAGSEFSERSHASH